MQITIDTAQPLSETDLAVLALLTGEQPVAQEQDETPAPAKKAPAKKAPAKKAAAKKAPAPEPEDDEEGDGPTLEDAVARAQELVGEKRTDEVKAAIAEIGVERVSKLRGEQIAQFLELVKDDEDAVV